jgi:alpha-glucosidase (family GH31 glycosyl hydrolase)
MRDTPSNQNLELVHIPCGENHPYEPLPYERFPRRPWVGQPVKLGVKTSADPCAEELWCTWRTGENHQLESVQGQRKESNDPGSELWEVSLPPFLKRGIIYYQLHARWGEKVVTSQEFAMPVAAWFSAMDIVSVQDESDGVTVIFSSTLPGLYLTLRVGIDHQGGLLLRLSARQQTELNIKREYKEKELQRSWNGLTLRLDGNPLQFELVRDSDQLKLTSASPFEALVEPDGSVTQFRLKFKSPEKEAFYGFGERFNAFDQRGNTLDNYVYAQYVNQGKRSYIPIPFFLSSQGYGVWLKTERQAYFDLASVDSHAWSLIGLAEKDTDVEIQFFFQSRPKEIVKAFTDITGKPKLPPAWVFGLWMSSNDWNTQTEVLRQLSLTQKYNIPSSVLVIEAWSDEINFYPWNDAQYKFKPSSQAYQLSDYGFPSDKHWPDPKSMVDQLHEAGLKLVLWQIPVFKYANPAEQLDDTQKNADEAYAQKKHYLIRKANGKPHRIESTSSWFGNSSVIDFTNPDAANWWMEKRAYLVKEMGVDGFKTDGGEHLWDDSAQFFNGMNGAQGINHYPVAYEGAYHKSMQSFRGDDHVLFSRAGYTGAQSVSCHWAGDEASNWNAFRSTIHAMLNAGMCGFSFMGWDIAGFAGPLPEVELYLRASAFSAFCPIMQYHSDGNARRIPSRDRTPWNVQEQSGDLQVIPTFRKFANLRYNLIPYILSQAFLSHQSGLPLMRGLPLEFPGDERIRTASFEYLFGEDLLVTPVIQKGVTEWPVYLPEGKWRDIWTGKVFEGFSEIKVDVPLDRIPVYQRINSILPLNLDQAAQLGSAVGNGTQSYQTLTLNVFADQSFETQIALSATEIKAIKVTQKSPDSNVRIDLPTYPKRLSLVVYGPEPVSVQLDKTMLPKIAVGSISETSGWYWSRESNETVISLPCLNESSSITIS